MFSSTSQPIVKYSSFSNNFCQIPPVNTFLSIWMNSTGTPLCSINPTTNPGVGLLGSIIIFLFFTASSTSSTSKARCGRCFTISGYGAFSSYLTQPTRYMFLGSLTYIFKSSRWTSPSLSISVGVQNEWYLYSDVFLRALVISSSIWMSCIGTSSTSINAVTTPSDGLIGPINTLRLLISAPMFSTSKATCATVFIISGYGTSSSYLTHATP